MKRSIFFAVPVVLAAFACCTEKEKTEFKGDADQAGDAAKNTYEDAKDATKQGINNAANDVAEKTK
jgi:hypothetical protein